MTDKEQIIIDGKGCRYKTWDAECSLTGDHYGDNMEPCKFIDEKSCYFKQLARKTQECEQKDKEINELHLIIDRLLEASGYDKNISSAEDFEDVYADIDYKLGSLDELKKECEELKKQLKTSEKWRIEAESLNEKLSIEKYRYHKALEEIEGYVRDNSDFDKSDILTSKTGAYDILDIINKAKGC